MIRATVLQHIDGALTAAGYHRTGDRTLRQRFDALLADHAKAMDLQANPAHDACRLKREELEASLARLKERYEDLQVKLSQALADRARLLRKAPTPATLAADQLDFTWSLVCDAIRRGTPECPNNPPWLTVPGVAVPERQRDAIAERLTGWAVRWGRHGSMMIADRREVAP